VVNSKEMPSQPLTEEQWNCLAANAWESRVGDALGIWVSVSEQVLRVIKGRQVLWQARCSTATRGVGSQEGSHRTPLGWHSVIEKVGDQAPWGRVFREKRATKEVWLPGDGVREDLVLTRILALDGEEPGKNKGGDVDSYARCIYIHGTNDELNIGKPTSHGCIRLTNDDVIVASGLVPLKTHVLITE